MLTTIEPLDYMGAWTEDGSEIWLPKQFYPTRGKAKKFVEDETGIHFTDIRCKSVYIRPMVKTEDNADNYDWWCDVLWIECPRTLRDAIPAWHIYFK